MGTVGGNLCLDTRCNYYDQTLEWRQAIEYCMKAPGPAGVAIEKPAGSVCWVALSSPKCKAVSSTDGAPPLMALGAEVVLQSTQGKRTLPVDALYADDGMAYLTKRRDEILTEVRLPARPGWKSTYWKLRRRGSFDFPVLGVAAAIKLGTGGVVEDARVALGGVASRPVLLPAASELVGNPLTDDAIAAFEHSAGRQARPLDNTDFDLHWRKRVARAFLRGVLQELRGDDMTTLGPLVRRATALIPVL
jgi:4-hydroxybenzoyl-CoA reductase subunit beta